MSVQRLLLQVRFDVRRDGFCILPESRFDVRCDVRRLVRHNVD